MTGFSRPTTTFFTTPLRPSQKVGRAYKTANLDNQTGAATLYTVTSGKTLYVKTLAFSGYNASAAAGGDIRIRDGSAVRFPISVPQAGVAAVTSIVQAAVHPIHFQEPLQFTTDVNIAIGAGTITYSILIVGYEE